MDLDADRCFAAARSGRGSPFHSLCIRQITSGSRSNVLRATVESCRAPANPLHRTAALRGIDSAVRCESGIVEGAGDGGFARSVSPPAIRNGAGRPRWVDRVEAHGMRPECLTGLYRSGPGEARSRISVGCQEQSLSNRPRITVRCSGQLTRPPARCRTRTSASTAAELQSYASTGTHGSV